MKNIFSMISLVASIVGMVAFFKGTIALLCLCAVIVIINSFVQVVTGEQKNFTTEILTIVVFLIISFFTKANWLEMIAFGLCIADLIFFVVGWIVELVYLRRNRF